MKGRCNICGTVDRLTRDHVPPLGTVRPSSLDVRDITDALACEPRKRRYAYGSVSVPSLCPDCNNRKLGQYYDPSLKDFCNRVAAWIRARYQQDLSLPHKFSVTLKPGRVARAIVGHLLAAEPRTDPTVIVRAPMADAMREYFLHPTRPFPDELTIYCWPYPSDWQVIIRGAGISRYGSKGAIVGDFLKFFPLAYWLAWDPPSNVRISLSRMVIDRKCGLDDDRSVGISLVGVPPIDWPERPLENGMLLVNSALTSIARPVSRKRPRGKRH